MRPRRSVTAPRSRPWRRRIQRLRPSCQVGARSPMAPASRGSGDRHRLQEGRRHFGGTRVRPRCRAGAGDDPRPRAGPPASLPAARRCARAERPRPGPSARSEMTARGERPAWWRLPSRERARDGLHVVEQGIARMHLRDALLQAGNGRRVEHGRQVGEQVAPVATAQELAFVDRRRVAELDAHQEAVELRFRQRERADLVRAGSGSRRRRTAPAARASRRRS